MLIAILAALWIFLEEWLWDRLLAAMAWLGRLPPVHWLEVHIGRLPPVAALAAFLIPAGVLLPFKILAFWLIAHGHGMLGIALFIVAKLVGTALLARIFSLTKPALLTIGWFAKAYSLVVAWRTRLYDYVRSLPSYRRLRVWMRFWRERLARHWRQWQARAG